MKYIFFFAAILGVVPAVMTMIFVRPSVRWFTLGLTLPLLLFDSTAINFFSCEMYRGTSRGMEISLIYITAAAILLTFFLLGRPLQFVPEPGVGIYLCYILMSLPSILNADEWLYSFFEVWKMLMIYMVFLAVYYYLEFSRGDFDILLYGVMAIIGVNLFVIAKQHFFGVYQVPGVFPHQNSMAMYMMMAGLLFFSRFFNRREVGYRSWLVLITFLLASAELVRTYSRGAIFCYPIGGILVLGCSFLKGFSLRKCYLTIILMFFAIFGLLLFLPKVIERFEKAPKSSGETRKNFAIAALNMIQDKPVIGVGLNNWGIKINPPYEYSRHRDPKKGYTEDHKDGIVETIYLLVAAECGIPCFLVLLTWFGYYWVLSIRLMRRMRWSKYYYIPAGIFGALTAAFLQSALEWILKQQINFMWMVMLFAFLSYLNRHGEELMNLEDIPKRLRRT